MRQPNECGKHWLAALRSRNFYINGAIRSGRPLEIETRNGKANDDQNPVQSVEKRSLDLEIYNCDTLYMFGPSTTLTNFNLTTGTLMGPFDPPSIDTRLSSKRPPHGRIPKPTVLEKVFDIEPHKFYKRIIV